MIYAILIVAERLQGNELNTRTYRSVNEVALVPRSTQEVFSIWRQAAALDGEKR
jgi:hypothetical protein